MTVLWKTLGFSVGLTMLFAGVAHMLPQMEGAAPEKIEIDVGNLTMDSFVAMGEELFQGKGTCALCHNNLGRAPDLMAFDVAQAALDRIADARYQGAATDAEGYLRESMLQPSAYVTAGFGQKGSNDTESPMPAADEPPIQLSELEIDAIIAFLQAKDGYPVTVALPAASTPAPAAEPAAVAAVSASPEEALTKYGCPACHSILESQVALGPNLRDLATRRSIDQIRDSIVNPRAVVDEGYLPIMPEFPTMTVKELEMIVGFLAEQGGDQP